MSKFEKNRLSHFKVAIDSITVADFREAQGLDLRTEVLEYREGGVNERSHKIAGQTRFTRITLARGSTDSLELFQWIQKAMQGTVERKSGAILACNQAGDVVSRYEFKDAWPCAYEGPNFTGDRTEVAIERLTLAHRGWELKPGDVKPNPDTLADAERSSAPAARTDEGAKAPPAKRGPDGYPPRTPAAQKGAETACAAADRAGISKRKVAALAVFTEEDEEGNAEVVHVGLSGGVDRTGQPTEAGKKRAADLQTELNKEQEPPKYVVHDSPKKVPNYTSAEGDPAPGNCAEPKAADYEGDKDGFDVRYRGRDGDWEKGPNKYAQTPGDSPSAENPNPQLKPCNTCQHNSAGIVGGGS